MEFCGKYNVQIKPQTRRNGKRRYAEKFSALSMETEQDITLYDYEIRDVDAWEGAGTPLRVFIDVTETFGTGPNGPTVSISVNNTDKLSFAGLGFGDGSNDSSMAFVASLDDANTALSALTIHTTAAEDAVSASGVLSLGACDSEGWMAESDVTTSAKERGAWGDWRGRCSDEGWAEHNISFRYRFGTLPIVESVWPFAAPVGGGLTVEVRVFVEGAPTVKAFHI